MSMRDYSLQKGRTEENVPRAAGGHDPGDANGSGSGPCRCEPSGTCFSPSPVRHSRCEDGMSHNRAGLAVAAEVMGLQPSPEEEAAQRSRVRSLAIPSFRLANVGITF